MVVRLGENYYIVRLGEKFMVQKKVIPLFVMQTVHLKIREIGYLTDSKKVTITTIPRPME